MDSAPVVITSVSVKEYGKVIIETSNGKRFHSDLSFFSKVYCFPQTEADWKKVAPDADGLALVWSSRLEVHVDQIMALATQVENNTQSA